MPSASCCFLHVFYIAGNQYQTESKRSKTFCGFFLDQKTTNAKRCPGWPRDRGGAPTPPGHSWHSRGPPVRWLMPFFGRKKANFWKTICAKVSIQSDLRISRNIRNGFRPDQENAKQKRTEREIQSRRGSRPFAAMEAMYQRGQSPPI